jgi:hypothetical protein
MPSNRHSVLERITHECEKNSSAEGERTAIPANPAGRKELQELSAVIVEASGKLKPTKTSVITCNLVHERERGLISG